MGLQLAVHVDDQAPATRSVDHPQAPQIGRLRRIVVYRRPEEGRDGPVQVLLNPAIIEASEERTTFTEGRLSMPGLFAAVVRPAAVRVRAQDLGGERFEILAEDEHASVLQHEIDHLDGLLIPDRLTGEERSRYMSELREAAAAGWPLERVAQAGDPQPADRTVPAPARSSV